MAGVFVEVRGGAQLVADHLYVVEDVDVAVEHQGERCAVCGHAVGCGACIIHAPLPAGLAEEVAMTRQKRVRMLQ
jgi:hypothetical protein